MEIQILRDANEVAERAADFIFEEALSSISSRGRFTLALSGGRTPIPMIRALARKKIPWESTFVFQVDERFAGAGHPDRNLTELAQVPVLAGRVHPMPVELADPESAASKYAVVLQEFAGNPAVLDVIHLGLGSDGHTASLVPDDAAANVIDRDVAVTGIYQGYRRLTLTFSILNRARRILWVVTGKEKMPALQRLLNQDASIPAGRVRFENALILADRAATD